MSDVKHTVDDQPSIRKWVMTHATRFVLVALVWAPQGHSDTALWQYPTNGHYYQQFDVNLTPLNAARVCTRRNGYVVSIADARENLFVSSMLRTSGVRSTLIGLTLTKRVNILRASTLVGYENHGRWADGQRYVFRYSSDPVTPPIRNSFNGFNTQPAGPHVFMSWRGVWSADAVMALLSNSSTETVAPFTYETYTVRHGVSSVTCEWDTDPR